MKSSRIKPKGNYVLIKFLKPDAKEYVSRGGIIIPETTARREQADKRYAKVLSIGQGDRDPETGNLIPMSVKPGDVVMLTKFAENEAPMDLEVDDEGEGEYAFVKEDYILAVITEGRDG